MFIGRRGGTTKDASIRILADNDSNISSKISSNYKMQVPTVTVPSIPPATTTPLPDELPYTEEELYMMSHLIGAEAGETEKSRQLVGLVVLNRMNSDDPNFPDTMEEVIFQSGQYACTWDGNYEKEPNEDEIESAKKVLSGDTDYELPAEVIFQSTSVLGVVHEKVWSEVMQNWTYFCAPY